MILVAFSFLGTALAMIPVAIFVRELGRANSAKEEIDIEETKARFDAACESSMSEPDPRDHWEKYYGPKAEWFPAILRASSISGHLDAFEFSKRFQNYCHFDNDPYDGSIELYFTPDCRTDWDPSADDLKWLEEMGVTNGWFNFTDGTEFAFSHGFSGAHRVKVQHPRWSEELWQEHNQ
jgi:hypothetical protein